MDTLTLVGILIGVVTLGLGGVLSLMETAVGSISLARVEALVKDEKPGSERLLRVVMDKPRHINLLVLLRTIAEVTGAVLTAAVLLRVVENDTWAIVAAIAAVTLYEFLVIGVLSRTMGRKNPYSISLACAPVLLGMSTIFGPVAWLLVKAGNILTPGKGFRDGPFATEIELREMVDIASERGIVESDERRMIQSVFDLADTTARTVMVPRPEMLWIEADKTVSQALNLCIRSGHSRVPVIGEDVDDIVGVAYLKDLIAHVHGASTEQRLVPVRQVMRSAKFVPDSRLLDDLLEEMQREQIHLGMLVDEYGAIAGLISMEDILEEIVGEISDEYDASETAPVEDLGDGSYRVVARLSLEEVEELFNDPAMVTELDTEPQVPEEELEDVESDVNIPDIEFSAEQREEVDTVAGLGAYELGRLPLPGAEITTAGLHFRFEGGKDRRGRVKIRSAIVRRVPTALDSSDSDPSTST